MKAEIHIESKVVLEMTEEEYRWLAQLAGQVSGQSRRSRFYQDFNGKAYALFVARRNEMQSNDPFPAGKPYFEVGKSGAITAFDIPETERYKDTPKLEEEYIPKDNEKVG